MPGYQSPGLEPDQSGVELLAVVILLTNIANVVTFCTAHAFSEEIVREKTQSKPLLYKTVHIFIRHLNEDLNVSPRILSVCNFETHTAAMTHEDTWPLKTSVFSSVKWGEVAPASLASLKG